MTDQTTPVKQGGTCRTLCWLIAIAAGGYLAFMLVNDYGQDRVQSGVIGIVTMLLTGLVMRWIFCRSGRSRVARRVEEAAARAEALKTEAAAQKPAVAEAVQSSAKAALQNEEKAAGAKNVVKPAHVKSKPAFDGPDAEALDDKLTESVLAAAAEIADKPASDTVKPADTPKADRPVTPSEKSSAGKPLELVDPMPAPARPEPKKSTAPIQVEAAKKETGEAKSKKAEAPADARSTAPKATKPKSPDLAVISPAPTAAAQNTPAAVAPGEKPAVSAPKVAEIKPLPPKGLENPENGTPDDLQKIDGIGEVEERALHDAGIYHYAQFVTMNRRELAWLDENIAATKDLPPSGDWRKQAIALSRKAG